MIEPRPKFVDAALLYRATADLDFQALLGRLNAPSKVENLPTGFTLEAEDDGVLLIHSDMRVRISCREYPVAAEAFQGILNTPLSRLAVGGMTAIVNGHEAHVQISVAPGTHSSGFDDTQIVSIETEDDYQMRLLMAQRVINIITDLSAPAAVHWCQSDQLLTADQFLAHRDQPLPLKLWLHPTTFPQGRTGLTGLNIDGAEQFLGKPLVFRPSPLSADAMMDHATDFITHCLKTKAQFADGATFGVNERDQVMVDQIAPTTEMPQGAIELSSVTPKEPEIQGGDKTAAPRLRQDRNTRPPRVRASAPAAKPAATAGTAQPVQQNRPDDAIRDVFRDGKRQVVKAGRDTASAAQQGFLERLPLALALPVTLLAGMVLYFGGMFAYDAFGLDQLALNADFWKAD